MDVLQKCADYSFARELRSESLYPYFRKISSPQDPVVTIDGEKVIMLGSNNYLGLTSHPEVKEASSKAVLKYGTGCAGSRFLNGTLDIHVELDERLATFMRKEAALTFSTGYQVNLGVLSCLLGRHDVAVLDKLDHASILDGVRLGFSKSLKYKHNDMKDLESKLASVGDSKGKLIVVDGVFSMDGDTAPLDEICALAREYGAMTYVDYAHGEGVLGEGRGIGVHYGVEDKVDIEMGTFSKAFGLAALRTGYAVADPEVVVELDKVLIAFAVNHLAQVASLAAIAARDEVQTVVDRITVERDRVVAALRAVLEFDF